MLSSCGYRVLVLEMHDRLGGCTHVFSWNKPATDAGHEGEAVSCEFDSGYHYTTQSFADPTSRAGAVLRHACGGLDAPVRFNDLGDPFDRLVFPKRCATASTAATASTGDEVRWVRGRRQLIDSLTAQLTSGDARTTTMMLLPWVAPPTAHSTADPQATAQTHTQTDATGTPARHPRTPTA